MQTSQGILVVALVLAAGFAGILATSDTGLLPPPSTAENIVYVCPMDRDIRSASPGNCSRCGMPLQAAIPDPVEFHLDLETTPKPARAGEPLHLSFTVHDPWKNNLVTNFTVVHEKLFHTFIVSRDLNFFIHDHPQWRDGAFHYDVVLPRPGMYRVLADFYPDGATPQMIAKTVFVAGPETSGASLKRDYDAKNGGNLRVDMRTIPADPVAGLETQLRFQMQPPEGLEKYLGAWGHLLAASEDLIDMIHEHPFVADGSGEVLFHATFPREGIYRVWVQFQREGIVNTVHFDIPVKPIGTDPFGRD